METLDSRNKEGLGIRSLGLEVALGLALGPNSKYFRLGEP